VARIPFVDTHIHLFDLRRTDLRYDWLEPQNIHPFLGDISPVRQARYGIDEYLAEVRFANVSKAVHVQCAGGSPDPVLETRWLQGLADRTGFPQAIVAECHLGGANAEAILDRHLEYANLRGIRDYNVGSVDYLSDPAWQRGCKLLARHDLVACIDTRYQRFDQVLGLAARAADVTICVDHCAIPEARTPEYFAAWRDALKGLARAENVIVKISGLGMYDHRWTIKSLRPWVLACIDAVGPDRIVFGANWPVDRMFSSYPDLVEAYATIIADFTDDEQRAMFAGNAERYFRI
jgi:predicted TIM-barrel fold metal-dependent hydrolase